MVMIMINQGHHILINDHEPRVIMILKPSGSSIKIISHDHLKWILRSGSWMLIKVRSDGLDHDVDLDLARAD